MPNISPINLDQPGPATDIVSAVKSKVGAVPNIFATMAQSPAVLEGFLAFKGALDSGHLTAGVREQIALAVAGENECDYCASAHSFLAKAAGIGILLAIPLGPTFVFLPLFGLALNGTSTVLYGTVAELAEPERHSRAFGLFYTLTTGASAVAPAVYGVISDFAGVPATLSIAAVIVLITIPLARLLRV